MNRRLLRLAWWSTLVGLLGGCAQYQWKKYGATREDFNRDTYQCQMEAASAYPAAIVNQQLMSGYQTPASTNCYSSGFGYSSTTTCTTTPGRTVPPVTYTVDANEDNRAQATKACMYARGYQLVQTK